MACFPFLAARVQQQQHHVSGLAGASTLEEEAILGLCSLLEERVFCSLPWPGTDRGAVCAPLLKYMSSLPGIKPLSDPKPASFPFAFHELRSYGAPEVGAGSSIHLLPF